MGRENDMSFGRWQLLGIPRGDATRFARLIFVAALGAALASTCFGQASALITVRILNAENGKPLKGAIVGLLDPNKMLKPGERMHQNPAVASAKTDTDGRAVLKLSGAVPESVVVQYADINRVYQCMPYIVFSTAEILKTGVVAPTNCAGSDFRYAGSANPGEMVLFGKPVSWWERMKRETF